MNTWLITRPARVFEEMFRTMDEMITHGQSRLSEGDFDFPVDVRNEKDHIVVRADVPGIPRDNLNITLENSILTITGERKKEKTDQSETYYSCERSFGTFSRSFRVPDVDKNSIKASLQDGVLQVILQRAVKAKSHKIEIG